MRATQHPSNNRVIGAPQGWEQGELPCSALAVTDAQVEGIDAIVSYWRPTAKELADLAAGGMVVLTVLGTRQPVVALGAEPAA